MIQDNEMGGRSRPAVVNLSEKWGSLMHVNHIKARPLPPSLQRLHWLRHFADEAFSSPDGPLPTAAEVVVVGGGYMGAATALWLGRLGIESLVVERRAMVSGATARNAGFIAPGLGQPFALALDRYGQSGALERLQFTRRGRDLALAVIAELAVDCDLEAQGGLTIAATAGEWQTLRASGTALWAAGFPIELVEPGDLAAHLHLPPPPTFLGALYNPETVLINPAKLARAMLAEAVRLGAILAPHTEVTSWQAEPGGGFVVETARGVVRARRLVLATNAWTPLLAGALRERVQPVRGQVFATVPAPPAFRRGMSFNEGYEYWSQRADGAIVLGGARWAADDRDEGYYAEDLNPAVQAALYRFLTESFPALAGIPVARAWSGIMGFSRDGYLLIGPMPGVPGLFVVAGFTGHGGPYSVIAGRCIADLIATGRSDQPLQHYALDRAI